MCGPMNEGTCDRDEFEEPLRQEGVYAHGKRDGQWIALFESGKKAWEGSYESGQKLFELSYKHGQEHGTGSAWHENGQKSLQG